VIGIVAAVGAAALADRVIVQGRVFGELPGLLGFPGSFSDAWFAIVLAAYAVKGTDGSCQPALAAGSPAHRGETKILVMVSWTAIVNTCAVFAMVV
jgi:hypothetical protein